MSALNVLLVGPPGHGGAGVHVSTLQNAPPTGVRYELSGPFKASAPGARCRIYQEVVLNRIVHPFLVPDIGFRALSLDGRFALIHVHAYPVRFSGLGRTPVVFSEGSSSAVYAEEYLGWDRARLRRGFRRNRFAYKVFGIHERLPILEKATRAYVFSHWARELNASWGADRRKIDVVYPGFPTPVLVPRAARDTFRFLFIGRDFERKGGFELVDAFASLVEEHPHARLTIVTESFDVRNPDRLSHSWVSAERRARGLRRLAALKRCGLVECLPLLDRGTIMREVYPQADAFVMVAHAEGFGFTNVEAMSFALPVISSTVGAIPEVVEHGATGFLLAPGDTDALGQAMARVITDRALAARLGETARARFLERFTLARSNAAVRSVYDQAIRQ